MRVQPVKSAVNLLRKFSLPLIAGVIVALLWANINLTSYARCINSPLLFGRSLHFFANDLFMVLFFGIAAVEITASLGSGGNLHPLSKTVNPLMATGGGVVCPIGCYFLLNAWYGQPAFTHGWGIPTATDIAIAWLVARFAFGKSHPCVSFLLLLAVADDAISLVIIAVFYPSSGYPVAPLWLFAVAAGVIVAWMLRRKGVQNYWPYLLVGGTASWLGLFEANLHPALALVFIVPFMPHRKDSPESTVFDEVKEEKLSYRTTLQRFEHDWKWIVDFGLLLFGLCNAGVAFASVSAVTAIVLLSLIVGKTAGISLFALAARHAGFPLPAGVAMKELFVMALIGGIGLTVSLFVAGEAFVDPQIQGGAKMGALASALIAPAALALARAFRIQRRNA